MALSSIQRPILTPVSRYAMRWPPLICRPLRSIYQTSIGVKNSGDIHMCRESHWHRSLGSVRPAICWPYEDCASKYLLPDQNVLLMGVPQEAERSQALGKG